MSSGVYIHIPFCRSRCSYCDFATDIYRDAALVDRYVTAVSREIYEHSLLAGERIPIDTIYFGGGTPSLLSPDQVDELLEWVRNTFAVSDRPEITLEINPATAELSVLKAFKQLGVNRASFGVQTFNDHALRLLARAHDARDARETFHTLRDAGFENISFDLIAGLPGQTLDDWQRNLDQAIELGPEHISLYLLEVHEGTPLAEQIRSGRQPRPDEDLAAEMYELMIDKLAGVGYHQYEISNFCKPGLESRHNLKYWRMQPVCGFGVSAHSFDGRERYANTRDTADYVSRIESHRSPEVMREAVDSVSEAAFLGLRLDAGIDLQAFKKAYGVNMTEKYSDELSELQLAGLLESVDGRLRLTRKGKLLSNEVFAVFV